MKNSKTLLILIISMASLTFTGCSSDDDTDRGNWQERSVFDGTPRSNSISFTIGNFGYMGTGYDGDDYLNDFWQYNIEGNYWVQKADFEGVARSSASGFAIDEKGYVGVGFDGDDELGDFWEYNPTTNEWTQKADFGGGVRRAAVEFGINGKGYIGTGNDGDNDKKDFWKYDPIADSWSELVGFGGEKRIDATTFTINDKVYLGTGVNNGLYKVDFWEFDPTTEVWTRKNDLDEDDDYSVVRSNAVGLTIGGLGYIATGYYGGAVGSIWEYDPTLDEWEEISDLEATVRQDAVAFSNGSRGFVLMGRTGSLYLDDIYELFPLDDYDDED
ncbi:galactose oxidase-like protein [Mariniflexile fucanivorans]|uniref:Galactose oxidase-like protein n=1 Tax=Mariniflexile fucanivorans TaxID=264023 RepID=A0A4R1RMA3_9FLAO|nr:galactose oxidase [Mariniflexile fucanivorans]TCL66932.1 galactose oxidase-like protein [Mariniflexile fucanivorans]